MKKSNITKETVEAVRKIIRQVGGNPIKIHKSPSELSKKLKITSWYHPVNIVKLEKALIKEDLATDVYYVQGLTGTLHTIIKLK